MDDRGFLGVFVAVVALVVFFLWARHDTVERTRACEAKKCPPPMTARYMQVGEYSRECQCVAVPR